MQQEQTPEFDIKLYEDDNHVYCDYSLGKDKFSLIYEKEKDICLLVKNKKPANLNLLIDDEVKRYKEVLDIIICYHHDRDGTYLN